MNNKDEMKYKELLEELLKAGYVDLFNYDGDVYAIKVKGDCIKNRRFPFINLTRKDTIYLPMLNHLITGERESINIEQLLGIVDWANIPIDTPVNVWNKGYTEKERRHFAGFKNGRVFTWSNGRTSFSNYKYSTDDWDYAELAKK